MILMIVNTHQSFIVHISRHYELINRSMTSLCRSLWRNVSHFSIVWRQKQSTQAIPSLGLLPLLLESRKKNTVPSAVKRRRNNSKWTTILQRTSAKNNLNLNEINSNFLVIMYSNIVIYKAYNARRDYTYNETPADSYSELSQ